MQTERVQGPGQEEENLIKSRAIHLGAGLVAAGVIFKEAAVLAVVGLGLVGGKLISSSWSKNK